MFRGADAGMHALSAVARGYVRVSSPIAFIARRFIRRAAVESGACDVCVDVGAGNAPYAATIKTAFGARRYIAVDVAPTNRTVVIGDACALPVQSACIELLVSFDVIQHLPDPERFLAEAARVLKVDGRMIVSFPFLYAECDFKDYQRWTMEGMMNLMRRSGLRPMVIWRRGGALFALACGLNWAMQHCIPGQRKSWRHSRNAVAVLRSALILLLSAPTTVVQWIALAIDSIVPSRGVYMGGIILAVKEDRSPRSE